MCVRVLCVVRALLISFQYFVYTTRISRFSVFFFSFYFLCCAFFPSTYFCVWSASCFMLRINAQFNRDTNCVCAHIFHITALWESSQLCVSLALILKCKRTKEKKNTEFHISTSFILQTISIKIVWEMIQTVGREWYECSNVVISTQQTHTYNKKKIRYNVHPINGYLIISLVNEIYTYIQHQVWKLLRKHLCRSWPWRSMHSIHQTCLSFNQISTLKSYSVRRNTKECK